MEPPFNIVQTIGVTPSRSPQPPRPCGHTPSPGAPLNDDDVAHETGPGLCFDDLCTYLSWARLINEEMPGLRTQQLTITTRDGGSGVFFHLRHNRVLQHNRAGGPCMPPYMADLSSNTPELLAQLRRAATYFESVTLQRVSRKTNGRAHARSRRAYGRASAGREGCTVSSTIVPVRLDTIPAEMATQRRWVAWCFACGGRAAS